MIVLATTLVLAVLGTWSLPQAAAAGATRFVATTGSDAENDCTDSTAPCRTIEHAIGQADPGDTVSIDTGKYDESVVISKSLTVVGAGATGSNRTTIDGNPASGDVSIIVRGIDSPPTVILKDLDVSGNSDDDGILVEDANVTILDDVVSQNDANGIHVLGVSAVTITDTTADSNGNSGLLVDQLRGLVKTADVQVDSADPTVTVTGSDLSNNAVSGINAEAGSTTVDSSTINGNGDAGAFVETASLDISTTTLDSNVAGGVEADRGAQVTLTRSTVSNTLPSKADGAQFGGGVLAFPGSTVDVNISTIFGNTNQGIYSDVAVVTVENSTITATTNNAGDTSGGPRGGIAVVSQEVPSLRTNAEAPVAVTPSVTLSGTIIADNTTLPDCDGAVVDAGYNLAGDTSCALSATGSISSGNPKLGAFANNGGLTKTLVPTKGSAAIDVIPSGQAGCSEGVNDQRGTSRPQGPTCDIGAVEAAQPPIVISPDQLPDGQVGEAYSATITATGGLGAPYTFTLDASSAPVPPGLSLAADGTITGTPTQAGTFPFTVSVDDPVLKNYSIVITAPASSPPASSPPASTPPASSPPVSSPPASSSPVSSPSLPTPSGTGSSSSLPVTAQTGADVAPLTLYALLALVIGGWLTFAGMTRRSGRRRSH